MENTEGSSITSSERRRWMSILASSQREEVEKLWNDLVSKPSFHWVRKPEFGSVMARVRANRTGPQFNLGEVAITRCSLKIDEGYLGVAYVVGRDKRHAALAALLDACLQRPLDSNRLRNGITFLADSINERRKKKLARAYATRVEFTETRDTGLHGR